MCVLVCVAIPSILEVSEGVTHLLPGGKRTIAVTSTRLTVHLMTESCEINIPIIVSEERNRKLSCILYQSSPDFHQRQPSSRGAKIISHIAEHDFQDENVAGVGPNHVVGPRA